MSKIIFKIVNSATWEDIQQQGSFAGSADDRRDGYVHLSSADQLRGTLNKHFRGLADLVLLAVDADALAPHLRWEPSRGGQLFPHLYGELPVSAIAWTARLSQDEVGRHILPDEVERMRQERG